MPEFNNEELYTIPEEYNECIDENFVRQMLLVILLYLTTQGISDNLAEWLAYSEGTAGYFEAFKHACLIENRPDMLVYYESLKITDSDSFDDQLTQKVLTYWNTLSAAQKKRIVYEEICRENRILSERAGFDS